MAAESLRLVGVVILAGGEARRMGGGDKWAAMIGPCSILERITARLRPQTPLMAINANGDPARLASFGLDVIADRSSSRQGPLSGVLAAMDWARDQSPTVPHKPSALPQSPVIVTVPADTPFLPPDLVARLMNAAATAHGSDGAPPIVSASSAGRTHPVISLWPLTLRNRLQAALTERTQLTGQAGSNRGLSMRDFIARYDHAVADFSASEGLEEETDGGDRDLIVDPFFNVNSPADLAEARRLATLRTVSLTGHGDACCDGRGKGRV